MLHQIHDVVPTAIASLASVGYFLDISVKGLVIDAEIVFRNPRPMIKLFRGCIHVTGSSLDHYYSTDQEIYGVGPSQLLTCKSLR